MWLIKKFEGLKYTSEQKEKNRLMYLERYIPGKSSLLGGIFYSDSASLLSGVSEIFDKENYKFVTDKKSPLIIDCGSNIGLGIIYFKKIFPNANIIAYEPDPNIFKVLEKNMQDRCYQGITLINKAIYHEEKEISFSVEGGFSGRINDTGKTLTNVQTEKLSNILKNKSVDFLKIDIEGAEYGVLEEARNSLKFVSNIFIEFHSETNKPQMLGEILNILKESGFRYHLKEAYVSPFPFIQQKLMMDMDFQTDIYAFRETNPI